MLDDDVQIMNEITRPPPPPPPPPADKSDDRNKGKGRGRGRGGQRGGGIGSSGRVGGSNGNRGGNNSGFKRRYDSSSDKMDRNVNMSISPTSQHSTWSSGVSNMSVDPQDPFASMSQVQVPNMPVPQSTSMSYPSNMTPGPNYNSTPNMPYPPSSMSDGSGVMSTGPNMSIGASNMPTGPNMPVGPNMPPGSAMPVGPSNMMPGTNMSGASNMPPLSNMPVGPTNMPPGSNMPVGPNNMPPVSNMQVGTSNIPTGPNMPIGSNNMPMGPSNMQMSPNMPMSSSNMPIPPNNMPIASNSMVMGPNMNFPMQTPMGMMPGSGGQPMMGSWNMDGQYVKQPITYTLSVLYPPNPGAPQPTTRERPQGCRTIFIGGLPELATEEIVTDVFGKCGEIQTIRMSKKNFCHIRYREEYCVDNAIYLSGWRMRVGNNTDVPNTGRLHVDFAQARDDQYEWECQNRIMQREKRHIDDLNRPPSPPPVPHFSDHEAGTMTENLKGETKNVGEVLETLAVWLERGDCSKRNSSTFYTLIQTASGHVKRLLSEQTEYEQELSKMKEDFKLKMSTISGQFGQIERVFACTSHQKVWDHFTKAQRKNITAWRKQLADVVALTSSSSNMVVEEDMELSEDESKQGEPEQKKKKNSKSVTVSDPDKLREASEAWARRNNPNKGNDISEQEHKQEIESIRDEMKAELTAKDQQLKILQQTLQGFQQQLLQARGLQNREINHKRNSISGEKAAENLVDEIVDKVTNAEVNDKEPPTESTVKSDKNELDTKSDIKVKDSSSEVKLSNLSGKEAKLVAVISTFLHVHPFGAGTDYIWSYLLKVDPGVTYQEVEELMSRHPDCFSMVIEGVGATLARKWKFVAFNQLV